MVRPAPLIEPRRRFRNEPRSDIPQRSLVARKFPHGGDQQFGIDAGFDQRAKLPLGRLARVWPRPRWIGLPKFLELFAYVRSACVSDRPGEFRILDSGLWNLSFILRDIGELTPPLTPSSNLGLPPPFPFFDLCRALPYPDHARRVDGPASVPLYTPASEFG